MFDPIHLVGIAVCLGVVAFGLWAIVDAILTNVRIERRARERRERRR